MTQTRPPQLFTWGIIGLILSIGFHYVWESSGEALPGIPWPAILGMVILSIVLLVLGWPIKKWNDGDRSRDIDPVRAARVAMMAKAAALAGALLTGWYLGAAFYLLFSVGGIRAQSAAGMLVAVGASAIVMVVGLIVESYCKLPPDDSAGADAA
jgi:hypothetical protein